MTAEPPSTDRPGTDLPSTDVPAHEAPTRDAPLSGPPTAEAPVVGYQQPPGYYPLHPPRPPSQLRLWVGRNAVLALIIAALVGFGGGGLVGAAAIHVLGHDGHSSSEHGSGRGDGNGNRNGDGNGGR